MKPPNAARRFFILLFLFVFSETSYAGSIDYTGPINLSVDRWLAVQKPSGFLPYGYDFLADEESEPDKISAANLTRQAGTAAAFADYYVLTEDSRTRPAIARLLTALGNHSIPVGKSLGQSLLEKTRLLSLPMGRYKLHSLLSRWGLLYKAKGPGKLLSPDKDYNKAFTGATALALIAELRYFRQSGDNRFAALRKAWLEGLISMHIPGDGFRISPNSINTDPYFDGESWLALAEYHRTFPDDQRISELLAEVDSALIQKYGKSFKLKFYHWGMMAAAARYFDTKDKKFLDYIRAQTGVFIDQRKSNGDYHNNCALAEGASDAWGALVAAGEGDSKLAGKTEDWVATELRKPLQVQPGQTEMVFSNAKITAPRLQEFAGSFLAGVHNPETQVDITAHCVSAMVKLTRHKRTRAKN